MKNMQFFLLSLILFSTTTFAEHVIPKISEKQANQIFKVADFSKTKNGWEGGCGIGSITHFEDLNGDGLKDAVISDESIMCYGKTGVGYHLIAQQKNGTWKKIFENTGIATFLKTKGKDGWFDIENGGAGFCFAVWRWNGTSYTVNRYQYQGQSCKISE